MIIIISLTHHTGTQKLPSITSDHRRTSCSLATPLRKNAGAVNSPSGGFSLFNGVMLGLWFGLWLQVLTGRGLDPGQQKKSNQRKQWLRIALETKLPKVVFTTKKAIYSKCMKYLYLASLLMKRPLPAKVIFIRDLVTSDPLVR